MARILCGILLLLELRGFSFCMSGSRWQKLIYYTQLSNLIAALSALMLCIFGDLTWIAPVRYLSTCMLILTFLVTICVLIPMGGDPKEFLWSGNSLYHHVLCPVLSTSSYVFFEQHSSMIWLPVIVTTVYGLIMLYLNAARKIDGPYPFFRVYNQPVAATVVWMAVLTAVMAAISFGVTRIAR